MTLLGFVAVGVVVALSATLLLIGLVGTPANTRLPSYQQSVKLNYPLAKRLLYPTVAFVVVYAAVGWPVLGVIAAAVAAVVPVNRARSREQAEYVAKTQAAAAWIEQLRDAVVAGGGIEVPLRRTAQTGPEKLRPYLRELAVSLDTHDTEDALAMLAAKVEHHLVDMLAVSYAVAVRESTRGLPDMLTGLAESGYDEVRTFTQVDASRKKVRSATRLILSIQGAIVGSAIVFAQDFLTVYTTLAGQMVLAVCGALTIGSLMWMSKLQVVERPPRFFALDSDTPTFDEVRVSDEGHVLSPLGRRGL